jgi:hypothetical protein
MGRIRRVRTARAPAVAPTPPRDGSRTRGPAAATAATGNGRAPSVGRCRGDGPATCASWLRVPIPPRMRSVRTTPGRSAASGSSEAPARAAAGTEPASPSWPATPAPDRDTQLPALSHPRSRGQARRTPRRRSRAPSTAPRIRANPAPPPDPPAADRIAPTRHSTRRPEEGTEPRRSSTHAHQRRPASTTASDQSPASAGGHRTPAGGDNANRNTSERRSSTLVRANTSGGQSSRSCVTPAPDTACHAEASVSRCACGPVGEESPAIAVIRGAGRSWDGGSVPGSRVSGDRSARPEGGAPRMLSLLG